MYVRQKKTGNKEVKIFADILFLWTVNGVCLVSCFLNPKVDLRPSFNKWVQWIFSNKG